MALSDGALEAAAPDELDFNITRRYVFDTADGWSGNAEETLRARATDTAFGIDKLEQSDHLAPLFRKEKTPG